MKGVEVRDVTRRVTKLEQEIGSPEGCEVCKDYDRPFSFTLDEREMRAKLKSYAAQVERPPDVIETVAFKATCKNCRSPYVQVLYVVYVESRAAA